MISNDYKVIETSSFDQTKKQKKNRHQSNKVITWDYGLSIPESKKSDEEILKIDIANLSNEYLFVYLFSDEFEPHLNRLDAVKSVAYRLYESDTGVNFVSGTLGTYHDGMFAINPDELRSKPPAEVDDGQEPLPAEPALRCMVGCFLLYKNRQGSTIIDHMTGHAYDRVTEAEFMSRVLVQIKQTAMPGDSKGLQAYWSSQLDLKRAREEADYTKQSKTIGNKAKRFVGFI